MASFKQSNCTKTNTQTEVTKSHSSLSPPLPSTTRKITPTMKHAKTSLDHRMMVDKDIVDELLLVCGVIGTETTNANGKKTLVPVTDCLNWLQDMQRALRRDEDLYRPISLLIGKWKVVEKKLLPLVIACRYDTAVVLTVVKILVILTKPLSENAKRAGQLVIDRTSTSFKKGGVDTELLVTQQQKIRANALEQAQQLMEYKRLLTFHPSHSKKNAQTRKEKKVGTGLLSIFVSLLAEPLSKSGASRTDTDHLTIELVLHLIRNLLSAEPLLNTALTTSQQATQLHQDMISLFETELVLDILLVVGQEMELPENSQYNLLMMEILHHILKGQDPMAVSRSITSRGSKGLTTAPQLSIQGSIGGKSSTSMSVLASKLKGEKAQLRTLATVRHGHFSGTWVQKEGEKRLFISASTAVQRGFVDSQSKHHVQARRKNRIAEPFIGSGKTLTVHTRLPAVDSGPATKRANETLNKFCKRFIIDCYGPFMKSLKNEFRRDSVRLEESDKVVFFRIIWFFSQWWRASASSRAKSTGVVRDTAVEVIGRLIITMDVFTFNLVLNATESFYNHKKHARLAQTVALYSEMMHLLHDMHTSKDKTEHEMAIGLIDRLFYGQEALDQIPKLISRWSPGTYTREYLCDLVEVIHVSLKLLEANTKKGIELVQTKGSSGNKGVSQKIARMRSTAADFDLKSYFVRKIVSNQMITMYGHLLSQYKVNATMVNHRIIAMFHRLIRVEIASPDITDSDTPLKLLGTKRVTLQPMLYNLQMIMTMEQILNDTSIRGDKDFESLIQFSTSLMYKFWAAAYANPMLYIECLFRHVSPHRFCELVTNMYVNDDLRMIAERAILLEEHNLLQEEDDDNGDTRMDRRQDRDDDEEELEFTDGAIFGSQAGSDPTGPSERGNDNRRTDGSENEESEDDNEYDVNDRIKAKENLKAAGGITARDSQDGGRKRRRDDEGLGQHLSNVGDEEIMNFPTKKVTRTERTKSSVD